MVAPRKKNTVSNKNELFTVFYDILQQRTVHAWINSSLMNLVFQVLVFKSAIPND